MTAILLYAQFSILRSRAILVIASGYLFTALIVVLYVLAFPGVLAPKGLDRRHADRGVALCHVAHGLSAVRDRLCLVEGRGPGQAPLAGQGRAPRSSGASPGRPPLAAAAAFCAQGPRMLPRIMLDPARFGPDWPYVVGAPIVAAVHRRASSCSGFAAARFSTSG